MPEHLTTDAQKQNTDHLQLFKLLVDQSSDAIFIVSPESGKVLYCNDKACSNLGYSREELLKKHVFDYALNVTTLKEWKVLVKEVAASENHIFETSQQHKDGSILAVEINTRLIEHLGQSYLLSFVRDITKRKESEALLVSNVEKIEAFMMALDDKITVQDQNLKIIYQNKAHEKLQGSHLGEYCYKAYQARKKACDGCLVIRSLEDGKIHKRETSALTAKGKVHLEVISCPVKDPIGEIIAAVEIVRDITKHKEAAEVLRNTAQVRKQFISTAAHELGTPLSAILGYAELLNNAKDYGSFDQEQQKEFIDIIHNKAEALTEIVDNLLDISRIDAGQFPSMEKEFCDFGPTLNNTITHYDELFPKHKLTITLPEEGLEPLWIDRNKMVQVLENLLTNAVKYSPEGGDIELNVKATYEHYHFALTDEGIGMTDAQIKRIFEPFYRAVSEDPDVSGLGLGMSVVKQIIKGHQGKIRIEHKAPKGLRVSFTLPRKKQETDS